MGRVNSAEWRYDLLQFDDLFKGRERARNVKQSCTQAECSIAHAFKLCRAWGAIGQSDHSFTHRVLADESRDIDGAGGCLQSIQKRFDRCRQAAHNGAGTIRTFKHGRHALADVIVGGWDGEDVARCMCVDINKARRHNEIAEVNHAGRGFADRWRYPHNGITTDGEVRAIPGAACPIHDTSATQHEIIRASSRWILLSQDLVDIEHNGGARGQMQEPAVGKFHDVSSKNLSPTLLRLLIMDSKSRMLASRW